MRVQNLPLHHGLSSAPEEEEEPPEEEEAGTLADDASLRQMTHHGRSALDVVSALLTPPYGEEGHGVRKFTGPMLKRDARPPHLWRRRWVEVTLEGFRSASKVRVSKDADTAVGKLVALYRDDEGVVDGFRGATLVENTVDFELEEPDDAPQRGAFFRRPKRGARLRAIPGSTPEALVAALAALGWPQRGEGRGPRDDDRPARDKADDDRRAVQALLLGLGDPAAAKALLVSARRAMDDEARDVAARGVRPHVAPLDAGPGDQLPDGVVVPFGVARGATFYAVGEPDHEADRDDEADPAASGMDERTSALIDAAVASRVIDDFSARRMRTQVPLGRTRGLRSLLRRRLRDVRRGLGYKSERRLPQVPEEPQGGLQDDASSADESHAAASHFEEEDDSHSSEEDAQDDANDSAIPHVGSSLSTHFLPEPPEESFDSDSSDDDQAGVNPRSRMPRRSTAHHFTQPARPNLLRHLSESRIALPPRAAPPPVADEDSKEAAEQGGLDDDDDKDFASSEKDFASSEKDFAEKEDCEEKGCSPLSPTSCEPRRFRRLMSEHGSLTWDAGVLDAGGFPSDAKRGLRTETCEAVVPHGARANSRLMVRVPGCTEPCIVVVPPEAPPGSRLRFRFFRVENEDGSTSCVRWSGFPHSDLSQAPRWRRERLEQRLKELRIPHADIPRDQRVDIVVKRSRFLESCLAALPRMGSSKGGSSGSKRWRQPWRIHYDGEKGLDAGGVTREFWTDVSKSLWNPDLGLFKFAATDNLTYEISTFAQTLYSPEAAARLYRTAGRLTAKALLDRQILSAALSRPLLKHILGQPVEFDDLQFVDASLHANLAWLLACEDPDDVELLCQSFTVGEETFFGVVKEVELVPGGSRVDVTHENRVTYVELRFKYAMMDRIAPALSPFLRGFYDVVPLASVAGQTRSPELLDSQELELVLFGLTEVDVDDWKAHTNYRNVAANDKRCKHFWRVVEDALDAHQRTRLLQFVTGTARLPAGGFKNLQGASGVTCAFEIRGLPGGDDATPRAHTCFNRLDLPLYSSYQRMRDVIVNIISLDVQGFTED